MKAAATPRHRPVVRAAAAPPPEHVRYRHPKTGDVRRGLLRAVGAKGGTVIDHDTGEEHKIDHGHYVKPSEENRAEHDQWRTTADRHLRLGPRNKNALRAVGAHLHALGLDPEKVAKRDVSFSGHTATIAGQAIKDAHLSAILRYLVAQPGKTLLPEGLELDAYEARIAAPGTPQPMAKGESGTDLRMSLAAASVEAWELAPFRAEYRHNGIVGVVSLIGGSLAVPYHQVARSISEARLRAQEMASDFVRGALPRDGVFRVMSL